MTISLYDISIPVFTRGLTTLDDILEKGESHATTNSLDPNTLLNGSLHPDMKNLIYQVQRVSDTAKNTAVRIGNVESVAMPDTEATFTELRARVAKTIEFLDKVDRSAIDGNEAKDVPFPTRAGDIKFVGTSYVLKYALPNFFFHVTTTYAILRHMGVDVGKMDYLGGKHLAAVN